MFNAILFNKSQDTVCFPFNSECFDGDGHDYSGKLNITINGRQCQRWDAQSPHQHNQNPAKFPSRTFAAEENFCRNPSDWSGTWCYTTDPSKRWEPCDLPVCGCTGRHSDSQLMAKSTFTVLT